MSGISADTMNDFVTVTVSEYSVQALLFCDCQDYLHLQMYNYTDFVLFRFRSSNSEQ